MQTDPVQFFQTYMAISALMSLVTAALAVAAFFRRREPLAEEFYKTIAGLATKDELNQLRSEYLKTTGEIFGAIRSQGETNTAQMSALLSGLKVLEGKISCFTLSCHYPPKEKG